ncbi:hypothetical protein SeLEV6574_g08045 [Synchytrium endobioticum]|uniref:Uncharacterized protein n=1 Tax=Synchytrium endobioticum TaxID=286115 RepID=A0A507CAD1_9FUNG|nr:hypothetical protein SeLEV6574_g08045 [Synchytrium endobioticum]
MTSSPSSIPDKRSTCVTTKTTLQHRLRGFALGALAACGAVTITNPFEVVKTRLQLQGEIEALKLAENPTTKAMLSQLRIYRGPISALVLIAQQEGLEGLQRGLIPAYGYQIFMNGTRLGLYDPLRDSIQAGMNYVTGRQDQPMIPVMVASGALSGFAGAFVGSPLFLIKTRDYYQYIVLKVYEAYGVAPAWPCSALERAPRYSFLRTT